MDNKSLKIYILLIVIVLAIVSLITYFKVDGNTDEKTIQCIADNSLLVIKEGCPACAAQEKILEGYLDKFETIDCAAESQKCMDLGVTHVPTWIINNQNYEGVHSIEQLKNLTGC